MDTIEGEDEGEIQCQAFGSGYCKDERNTRWSFGYIGFCVLHILVFSNTHTIICLVKIQHSRKIQFHFSPSKVTCFSYSHQNFKRFSITDNKIVARTWLPTATTTAWIAATRQRGKARMDGNVAKLLPTLAMKFMQSFHVAFLLSA